MRFLPFLSLLILIALTACGPALESATYTLPPTAGGRMCTHQCSEAQDYCHQTCDLKQRQCVTEVQTRALTDYDNYTRAQFFNHEPIELTPSDFERQGPCTKDRNACANDCDRTFQGCYSDCGGTVSMTSSCQFLCF